VARDATADSDAASSLQRRRSGSYTRPCKRSLGRNIRPSRTSHRGRSALFEELIAQRTYDGQICGARTSHRWSAAHSRNRLGLTAARRLSRKICRPSCLRINGPMAAVAIIACRGACAIRASGRTAQLWRGLILIVLQPEAHPVYRAACDARRAAGLLKTCSLLSTESNPPACVVAHGCIGLPHEREVGSPSATTAAPRSLVHVEHGERVSIAVSLLQTVGRRLLLRRRRQTRARPPPSYIEDNPHHSIGDGGGLDVQGARGQCFIT